MRVASSTWKRAIRAALLTGALWPSSAMAYRPFDSTDAAVAEVGALELELQPLGLARTREGRSLVPSAVLNWGFAPRLELVLEAREEVAAGDDVARSRFQPVEAALGLKGVLREGSLQDRPGPSVAGELGLLPPLSRGDGVGARGGLIVSERWDAATVHLNGQAGWTRAGGGLLAAGIIVEGPDTWTVRPVTELLTERAERAGATRSALLGAIWRVRDGLSLDAAVKAERAGATQGIELRLGVTWDVRFGAER